MEMYFDAFFKANDMNLIAAHGSVSIDCKHLVSNDHVKQKLPTLLEDLMNQPDRVISCLGR